MGPESRNIMFVPGYGHLEMVPVRSFEPGELVAFRDDYKAFISANANPIGRITNDLKDPYNAFGEAFYLILNDFIFRARGGWVSRRELHQVHTDVYAERSDIYPRQARLYANKLSHYIEKYAEDTVPMVPFIDPALPLLAESGKIPQVVGMVVVPRVPFVRAVVTELVPSRPQTVPAQVA